MNYGGENAGNTGTYTTNNIGVITTEYMSNKTCMIEITFLMPILSFVNCSTYIYIKY